MTTFRIEWDAGFTILRGRVMRDSTVYICTIRFPLGITINKQILIRKIRDLGAKPGDIIKNDGLFTRSETATIPKIIVIP